MGVSREPESVRKDGEKSRTIRLVDLAEHRGEQQSEVRGLDGHGPSLAERAPANSVSEHDAAAYDTAVTSTLTVIVLVLASVKITPRMGDTSK